MIRALVFDFDGLILDTEGPEFLTWQEIYEDFGCTLSFEAWAVSIGTVGGFDPYAELEAQLGHPVDRDEIRLRRRRRNQELLANEPIRPGVAEYLDAARRLGMRIGIASSSPRDWVAGHLSRLGLIERFDCVRCSDDVSRVKPDPELYQSALAALSVAPAESIALEDSPNGVVAAKSAGMYCVAVPNALTGKLPLDHADLQLDSLADLPLEDLLKRIA